MIRKMIGPGLKFLGGSAAMLLAACLCATAAKAERPAVCPAGDTCVAIGPGDSLRLASFLDNTTTLPSGGTAVNPANGIDDRRGLEVAHLFRPQALGHKIVLVGPDLLAGLPNYRENCNNSSTTLPTNQVTASAIVANPTILAVLGLVCSNSGLQAAPIFTAAHVPIVSVNNQAPAVTDPDCVSHPTACRPANSFYARTAPNGKFQGAVLAAEVNALGYTMAATVDDGSAFSHGLAVSFATNFNGTTTNYSPVTTAAQIDATIDAINTAGAPDIVYVTNTSLGQLQAFVTHAKDRLAPDLPASTVLAAGQVAQTKAFWEPGLGGIGALANGVQVTTIDRTFTTTDDYVEFLETYKLLSGGAAPDQNFHGFSFDAYNIVVDAIEKVAIKNGPLANNSWLIPRQALRDELLFHTNTTGLTTPSGGVTLTSGKLNCNNENPNVGGNVGDCSPGAGYYTVDQIVCPPVSGGGGTCNFSDQPLP